MAAGLIPLAIFLLNETTNDLYVLPPEAASQVDVARPCAPMKATITAMTFSASTLDQMCTQLAQNLVPKVNALIKTQFSVEHAQAIGKAIRALQTAPGLRSELSVWPPEIPFSLSGLTASEGMTLFFGVKPADKQATSIERVDIWSNIEGRFSRAYWSRSMHDPMYLSPQSRILSRVTSFIQRTWKTQTKAIEKDKSKVLRILVDKKISDKELNTIESVVRASTKGAIDNALSPVEVRKDGIIYQTLAAKAKQDDIVARLARELPTFRTQVIEDDAVDVSVLLQ